MAELVDAADLKSVDHCDRGSSSLPTPIVSEGLNENYKYPKMT